MDAVKFEIDESISSVLPALPGALGATIVFAGLEALGEHLVDRTRVALGRHRETGGLEGSLTLKRPRVKRTRGYTWPGPASVVMGNARAPYGAAFEAWSAGAVLAGSGLLASQVRHLGSGAATSKMAVAMKRRTGSLVRKLRGVERWRAGEKRLAALDLDFQ